MGRTCFRSCKILLPLLGSFVLTLVALFAFTADEAFQTPNHVIRILSNKEFIRSRAGAQNGLSGESKWVILPQKMGEVVIHEGAEKNPHNYSYILNSPNICDSFDQSQIKLLIFIISDVRNAARRQTIRDTWAVRMLQNTLNFRIVFLLGASQTKGTQDIVQDEFFLYGDIVQEDFPESFNNLGLKSVMGLKWSHLFCPTADFVMKTDDDIYIHIPNLLKILREQKQGDLLLCHMNRVRRIIRPIDTLSNNSLAKYQVSVNSLPGTFFPPYCAGFGYVMSRDVVERLYEAALITPYFFIEDAYVTGFCRHKIGKGISDNAAFSLYPPITIPQASCVFAEGRVTSHQLQGSELRDLWTQINTQGFFCPQPI